MDVVDPLPRVILNRGAEQVLDRYAQRPRNPDRQQHRRHHPASLDRVDGSTGLDTRPGGCYSTTGSYSTTGGYSTRIAGVS